MPPTEFDWKLGIAGPVFLEEAKFRIGLASRNYCADNGLSAKGQVVRKAVALAKERGDKLVRVEYLLVARGADVKTVGDEGEPLRRQMARTRRKTRVEAVAAAKEAKRQKRREAREAKEAAKQQ